MSTTEEETSASQNQSSSSARLAPTLAVVPKHYHLTYHKIDFGNFTFQGRVSIECTAKKSMTMMEQETMQTSQKATSVTLHAYELQLTKATLQRFVVVQDNDENDSVGAAMEAVEFRYHLEHQTVEIVFDDNDDDNTKNFFENKAGGSSSEDSTEEDYYYVLTIDFCGILNDQMRGLYRSTYQGLDGETHIMATTQFEPTDARCAFPCWDEPALKATFCLTVTIPAHMNCISNTPMASQYTSYHHNNEQQSSGGPTKTITFQKTPKMSTYLLALVVGQFDGISQTSSQIVTTVWTVPGKAAQAKFCLDTAVRCLDLFQQLFHVPYPLVKSDLIAIPDFSAGAMENWGCVTYREAKVLVKEGSTSESAKRGIARTVCHELAHQWFGNLVSMDFWSQLWLKEGAARYMEFVGCDDLFPEWEIWTEFVQSVYGLALSLDAMKSSHPVEVEVHHPDEINEIFDAISYAKGASIIRMIASYIGREAFFEGLRIYLSRHAYGNAVTNDVWRALQEASGVPVVDLMRAWTLEVGFPILLLADDGSIEVTRFLSSGRENEEESTTRWSIPVTAIVEGVSDVQGPWIINGPNGDETETLQAKIAEWSSSSNNKWFKLNVGQTGFFRVAYTAEQWKRLSLVMDPDGPLSIDDRLGLVSDSFAAGRSGYSSIVDSLSLIERFGEHERAEYAVWQELSENLASLASLLRSEPFFPKLQSFIKRIYSDHMERLGWQALPDESPRTGTLRATVMSMMGIAGDDKVLKEAFDRFMAFASDPNGAAIDGDLQKAVFRCALRYDEASTFEALKNIFEKSTFPEEQRNCLSVMGCVTDESRHGAMLDYVFFSTRVRLQDISFPLASSSGTTDFGGRNTWQFFKDNYSGLRDRLGEGPMWAPCIGLSCRGLTSLKDADEVEQFFNEPSHPPGSGQRRLIQALEIIRTQAKRRDRDRVLVEQYLASNSSSS